MSTFRPVDAGAWRRSRLATITLKASILDTTQPKTVVDQLAPKVTAYAKQLPAGPLGP